MKTPTVLKCAGSVAVAVALVAAVSCRDFDEAYYDQCIRLQHCYDEDAGTDGGTNPGDDAGTDGGTNPGDDAGTDGGTNPGNDAGTDGGTNALPDGGYNPPDAGDGGYNPPDSGYNPPDAGDGGYNPPDADDGGSEPDGGDDGGPIDSGTTVPDASTDEQVRRGTACTTGLCLRDQYTLTGPYEFQGLWGSSPNEVFLAARARPGVEAPARVVRFSGGNFSVSTVNVPGFQPFRLRGSDPTNLWAINEAPATGAFFFDGETWRPAGYVTNWTTLMAPSFNVGSMSPEGESFVAIAGSNERNLYAATASRVLRWVPGSGWQTEAFVPWLRGLTPSVQDIWINHDGSDVWVALNASYVLRKHDGQWSVVHLPVDPSFSALRIQGFDTPAGDLWITGTWSSDLASGTSAYHYERQDP